MARNKTSGIVEPESIKDEIVQPEVMETAAEQATSAETVCETVAEESAASSTTSLVFESMKSGANAAQEAAAKFVPTVGENIRKVAYKGIYYVSFGATFGALVMAKLVPADSFVGHALIDGAVAAKDAFRKQLKKAAAAEMESTLEPAAA